MEKKRGRKGGGREEEGRGGRWEKRGIKTLIVWSSDIVTSVESLYCKSFIVPV